MRLGDDDSFGGDDDDDGDESPGRPTDRPTAVHTHTHVLLLCITRVRCMHASERARARMAVAALGGAKAVATKRRTGFREEKNKRHALTTDAAASSSRNRLLNPTRPRFPLAWARRGAHDVRRWGLGDRRERGGPTTGRASFTNPQRVCVCTPYTTLLLRSNA